MDLSYQVKRSARKTIAVAVLNNGEIEIKAPFWVTDSQIKKIVKARNKWIQKTRDRQKLLYSHPDLTDDTDDHFKKYKPLSLQFCLEKIQYWNRFYGFDFNNIAVKKVRSRWGSCSTKKNLNFNYKILFLPEKLADYIIVHELCHLKEMNHSPQFWSLVAQTIPDWKERRSRL